MKKFILLSFVFISTIAFSHTWEDDFTEPEFDVSRTEVWQEIATENYGMARYLLNRVQNYTVDDVLYEKLIQLYISIKEKDKQETRDIIHSLDNYLLSNFEAEQWKN